MKKFISFYLLIQFFFITNSYSQVNLGFTGGFGFPVAAEDFKDNYKMSLNAGLQHEWTAGKSSALGWEFNLAHFIPAKEELDPVQAIGILFFIKFQDNTMREKDFQYFFRGGAGFGLTPDGKTGGHPSFPPFALTFTGSGGANYILPGGDKIFAETTYRIYLTGAKSKTYNSVNFNIGYSFCLTR